MRKEVINAFKSVSNGYSIDRVLVDPTLNIHFLDACRKLGCQDSAEKLNQTLLNIRKSGALTDYRTTKQTRLKDANDYCFASEIAARFLERRDGLSLDKILCCPTLVLEFDQIASRICPDYSPLQYRWAALNLRKRRSLKPEPVSHVVRSEQDINISVDDIDTSSLPLNQGIYIFFDSQQTLYVGESQNLKKRLEKHLDHSDNKGLARWLWEHGDSDLNLDMRVLPKKTTTRTRRALEYELIQSRKPLFNVLGRA